MNMNKARPKGEETDNNGTEEEELSEEGNRKRQGFRGLGY